MPATEVALLAGQITVEHVRLLVDAKQLSPEAFTADEDRLVSAAARRYGWPSSRRPSPTGSTSTSPT